MFLLQTFITHQIHRLQGPKHHSVIDTVTGVEDDEDEEMIRDEFNLNKMIIAVTSTGKVSFRV